MKMLHGAILFVFLVPLAPARSQTQGLSLTIGNSVAGQNYVMKTAQFIFRVNGCADMPKAQVTATAEGIVGGVRRSTQLRPVADQTRPGVYAIADQGNQDGLWVVVIAANCGSEITSAIVPMNGRGFNREGIRTFSHAPSRDEIDAALKASR
jgi:hypothetical protein